ncbi:hypothetical protein SLEP1_g26984 [Rubroshorea leprosula]|uniref:DUF4283 domain-containing protein n=1 Tax=Rubroshorea leprosula TaxID=152421 RepID=A0AAV5JUF2_9ROSI|nr:hypothetical protein SLEP1_g26984 [Rubroshorea leprosula]
MTKPSIKDLMVALGGKLSLTVEEDVGLDLDADKQNNQPIEAAKWCLVHTLLIRSRYNLKALKNMLANVLVEGPWHFVNHTMVLKKAHGGRQVTKEEWFEVLFWVQIHGLPPNPTETGRPIGAGMSRLIDADIGDRDT